LRRSALAYVIIFIGISAYTPYLTLYYQSLGISLGFIGALSDYKIDFELIAGIARKHPSWSIILIGVTGEGERRADLVERHDPAKHDARLLAPKDFTRELHGRRHRRNPVEPVENREHAQGVTTWNPELVSGKRDKPQLARPLVIVNERIVRRIVGEELVISARRDASDLVAAEGNAAVGLAVDVGVAA